MKALLGLLSILALGLCLASPVLYFLGIVSRQAFRTAFLLSSIAWFVLAASWSAARKAKMRDGDSRTDAA